MKITCEQVVHWLKERKVSTTAASIAMNMQNTSSRSVATALRAAVKDGRVSAHFRRPAKGQQKCCMYRFVRMTPRAKS